MTVINEWKLFLRHAWSVRLTAMAVVAALLSGAAYAYPFLDGYLPIPPWAFALTGAVLQSASVIASNIEQRELR